MKLIIAGSRDIDKYRAAFESIKWLNLSPILPEEYISGEATGPDQVPFLLEEIDGIPVKRFPADWKHYGKAAGHIRNKQMAEYSDMLLLIWDGESKGAANMKANMEKLDKPLFEIIIGKKKRVKDDL